jgi:predicted FMN-binding regulatory protein PaiB
LAINLFPLGVRQCKTFQLSEAEACDVIKEYGFAALFSTAEGMPYATHLPLMMSKNNECLYGHFAHTKLSSLNMD